MGAVAALLSTLRSFVCTDLAVHSECCSDEEGCECDMNSHSNSSPNYEIDLKSAGYEMHVAKS